ncbi:MAG: ABC transporter ATP-binding protein [Oscillospiraceae bacterium]|nr:ABC transporter ATP-binding protein [Oscillospiraceae bacterium]
MIKMTNVKKAFGTQTVLSDVTFEARAREIFGLLGPSGAGKTTIINILTNQLDADSGAHGIDVSAYETGMMLDEDGLYTRLSCMDNLCIFTDIYGIPRLKAKEALKKVGLADASNKAVSKLSKGMRQRLALARAILHNPKVLFLDEPTSGLDPNSAQSIRTLIETLRNQGSTIFLTTHNMEEAVKLCDYVVLLNRGKIVEQGAPEEICNRHNSYKTVPDLESVFIEVTGEQFCAYENETGIGRFKIAPSA